MAGSKNKSFWQRVQNGVRDVFDANTEDDQIRRQQAGQPRYYQQQQAQQKNPTVRYGTNPVSQAVNRARDYVDANTAQDRAARLAQGRKELEQRTFQAKYAPFLKPAKQVWNVTTANPIMNPIGFAMKASEPVKPVHNLVGGVEQGVSRSLVGTAQSTAGLVDLLSPGTGQSTATKFLNKTAEGIDQNVKNNGYNNITYKGAQAATDVGTFLVPGAGASKIVSAIGKAGKFVPGGSKAYNTVIKAMDTASKTLDDSGKIGQVTNKVGKFYLKPENAIDIGVDTGLNAGFRSARGEDNSPSTFGQDFGLSTAFSGGIGLGALGAKKAVTKLFKEKDIKQIAKSTDVNEIRNALEMRYPNLNSYELDRMAGDLVNKTTKKEVKGALEEAVVKDTAKGATPENTSETATTDITQPTEGPTRLSDTNTVEGPTRLSDTNPTQTPAQATATIKQRYPQLDETKAVELDTRLNLAKTPEEKAIVELEAKARNDAIQAEVKQATSPQTVAPSQQAIEADTQVMADNTANVAPQAIKAPGEPNTKTMQDLQQLGVSQQDLENAQLPEIKQNPVLTDLINATEDLKKEGIPESAIDRAMKDPNAPSDPAEFKNFVRRIANTQTQSNDVLEVQRAMMEAYNRGDIETANMLNDSLRESGNNPLANNFPSPTNQVNPTPPINKQTNTANSTPAKTTVEVDSLYDGGKSSKDGSDLYGTPDGYKYTVEMPSQKDVETVRTKRAEYNANGSGFSSTKSDIVVKDEDGDVVRIIDYDKAVEKYGATDPEKLANLAANQGVEPATPKPVAPKGVAPKSAPKTVYHGSSAGGGETGDRFGKGFYVTTDKNRASGYANGGAVDEYSLDGTKLANLDDKIDSKIVDTLKKEINDSIKRGDDSYKDAIRLSVGEKKFTGSDMVSARQFRDEKAGIATKLGLDEPTVRKNSNGDFTVTYIDDTLESLKNIDGNRLFRSLPSPTAQSLFSSAGYDGVSYRGMGGDIESVIYSGNLKKSTPVSAPIENPKAPEPSLATNNTEQKLGYVKKLSVEREMLLAQLDSKNGRMYGNQYTEIANRLDEIDQEINDYLYNAKPTPIKVSDAPQAAPIEKPAPRQTNEIVDNGGQGATYTDPKTGKQTYLTEDELLEELLRLQSIPATQRTGADATNLADIRKVLNKNRADANTPASQTPPIESPKAPAIVDHQLPYNDSLDRANAQHLQNLTNRAENSPVVKLAQQDGDPARMAYLDKIANTGDVNNIPEVNSKPIQANVDEPTPKKPQETNEQVIARLTEEQKLYAKGTDDWNRKEGLKQELAASKNAPEGVDPLTGEIKQAPAKDLIDVYNEAPASGSGIESAEKFINDVGASADAHINNLKADLEANGHTYQEFHDVIQQADRNGTTPPDWAQSTYGKYIRPYVDRAAEFGGKVDKAQIEAHPWYLPQRKPTQSGDELFTGDTMIDILDIGDSGFSKTRENKIPLGSLDNSTDPLKSYFVKNASLQHTDDLQVKKLMEANPNMSKEQATTYVGKKKEQINKLAADAEEGGMFSSQVEKNNYADETRAIGKETGAKTITIDNKHGRAYNFFSSSNEFQGDVKFTDTDGVVRSVKEASGTHLYNNAGAYGDAVAREAYKGGKLSPKTVKEGLAAHTTSTKITQSQIDEIGDKAVKDLQNYDDQLAFNKKNGVAEPSKREVDEIRQYIMARAHRKLARVQIDNFFAEADFTGNMALKRNLERDAKDILLYDSTANSLADKTANAIRGTIYRGFLGYNPVSALQNVTELRRAYGLFGEKGFAQAGKKALADLDIVQRYGLTESVHKKKSYSQQAKDGSSSSRVTKKDLLKPMGGFNATEEFKDAVFLHGLEAKVREEQPGLNALDFKKAVLDEFDQVGFKGGRKGSLGFNKQKVMGTVLQFMQYSVKDWKYTASKIGQAVKGDRQAQKYLARKGAADVATYFALSYAIGATAESVFNFRNPASEDYRTKDAPLDVKGLSYARNLTGAGGGLMIDAYSAYRMNQEAAKSEDKQADTTANVLKNQAIKDAAILVPGGNQIFNKTGGFITDMRRGYNENSSGLARFGVPKVNTDEGAKKTAQNVFGVAKGLVLGKYQTDQAKEYFGSNKIASDVREKFGGAGQAHNPVSQRYQDEITKNSNQDQNPAAMMSRFQMKQGSVGDKLKAAFGSNTKDTAKIDATINAARGAQDLKKNFALDSPEANDLYKTLYDTKKLPNGKIETNTISKERWSKLGSNDAKTEKSIEFLHQKAIKNNKDFGDPIDPVFDLSPNQRREIIALRAMNTGDDAEPKGILRQEAWYKTYKDKEDAYFKEQAKRGFTEGDLVQSPRVKQYYKLQGQNPSIEENTAKTHPLVNQYYKSGPDGSDARKAFYKANADKLSAEFGNLAEQKWAWTNEMRNLEGATPISWKDFQNSSYGFEPDEAKLASQLYFKNGGYGGKSGYTKFRSTSDQPTQYKLYLDQLLANDKNAKPISSLKIDTTPAKVKMKSFAPKAAKIKRIRIK